MSTRLLSGVFVFTALIVFGPAVSWAEDISASVAEHLRQGKLANSEAFLNERLTTHPKHGQARFALGVVKVLSAIEKLGQDQYAYGALSGNIRNLPVLRIPVPMNSAPKPITCQQVRQIFADFQLRIVQAEAELAKVELSLDLKLRLNLVEISLDLTGDGILEKKEGFLQLLGAVNPARPGQPQANLNVAFDAGDVLWLRGYCHFLAAFCDIVLAYDHQRLFNHTGQLIYPKHVSSEPVTEPLDLIQKNDWTWQIVDVIAAIHLMNFQLKEPQRMESARQHLLEMIRTSRQSWKLILEETDDDAEWLPNPKQAGVLRVPVTRELIDGWHAVLAEMEELFEGRKLVPYWRDYMTYFAGSGQNIPETGRGINLKRFFTEPREFDLILLMQGTGALPFVENGRLSRPETWDNLSRVFNGQFFGFAMWFN